MKKLLLLVPVALATWFCSSATDDIAKGPGSETTNGLALVDGKPASYASVALRKVDFKAAQAVEENALVVADAYADENGLFDVKVPADGKYRLTVVHDGVAFSKIVSRSDFGENGAVNDTVNLVATALMAGVVDVPEGSSNVWVGVHGTDVLVKSDSNGWFALPSLPANDSLRLYFVDGDYKESLGEESLYLKPRESVLKDYRAPNPDEGKIVVLQKNGSPAAYATVALRAADAKAEKFAVQNAMVDSDVRTDANGRFTMEWPEKGEYRLTVVSDGFAFSKVFDAEDLPDLDTIWISATASVSSKVTLRTVDEFLWVGVYGLDVLVKTNDVGAYVLPSVPAGDSLPIYFVTADSLNSLYAEWNTVAESNSTQFLNPVKVLQDFENGGEGWYLNTDSLKKGTEIKPANSVKEGIVYDSTRKSKVFHGTYKLANDDYAWALVGTAFEHNMKFSEIDSVVFYAKGNGNIRLSLENYIDQSKNLKAATEWIPLSKDWQRISVNPAELCVGAATTESCFTSWSGVKSWVKQFHIFVQDGSEFYVDDVILYGALF
ncbi:MULTISPECIES: carboxypeptidase-like regulatory domain-containing protein [unclassified Fibrobacter]|uniref:carboxypeptidase-like regulatory domain-containing protein n=1 Tax=Fibrobacter sp. UWR3 TaxID=1896217 RepID=UPI000922B7AF|nr:carboxypeptidase-like regulatory domain-containing protein [Fibrobacter sp. UWR3]SHM22791.1 Carboxypeptidase regulatory-like domain-containing protein [Fibrobacter sp. UWR3]